MKEVNSDLYTLWQFCQNSIFESYDDISKIVNELKFGEEVRPDHKKNMLFALDRMRKEILDFEYFVKRL